MVSKSKSKQKRKEKSKINIKQKQGTHIKIHIDNSKHTKRGVAKINSRPQPTIIHTNSPSQSQPFLIYNNPLQPPQIPLGDISMVKNTIGEKPRDIVKETLYEQENKPISIGDLQREKYKYEKPIYKETNKGKFDDELMQSVNEQNKSFEERQIEKEILMADIRLLGGYNEEYLNHIKNNKQKLVSYRNTLQKKLPEK